MKSHFCWLEHFQFLQFYCCHFATSRCLFSMIDMFLKMVSSDARRESPCSQNNFPMNHFPAVFDSLCNASERTAESLSLGVKQRRMAFRNAVGATYWKPAQPKPTAHCIRVNMRNTNAITVKFTKLSMEILMRKKQEQRLIFLRRPRRSNSFARAWRCFHTPCPSSGSARSTHSSEMLPRGIGC